MVLWLSLVYYGMLYGTLGDVDNVMEVLGWIIIWGDIGSDEEPLMVARNENHGDGVEGDWGGVFNVPVVSIVVPKEHDATFMSTGCAGGQDVVPKLKGGVFVHGDLGFCQDAKIKI